MLAVGDVVPFQLHFVVLICSSASSTRLERLSEKSFCLSLALPEQDESFFVEFFSARLGIDDCNSKLDVPKVVHDLCDSHRSCLVHC
jgi:hypothetical protein